jgi:hypothetical protein
MKFIIEQIALCPRDPAAAIELLTAIGLGEWARDHVIAAGLVYGKGGGNEADLAFNYQATSDKSLELEVLHYTTGPNWMERHGPSASHLAMHVTQDELVRWSALFEARGIEASQIVRTSSHTNPVISGKREYIYAIFDTRSILGIDLKFIVRQDVEKA